MYKIRKEKNFIFFTDLENGKEVKFDINTNTHYGLRNTEVKRPNPIVSKAIENFKTEDFVLRRLLLFLKYKSNLKYLPTIEKFAIFGFAIGEYDLKFFSKISLTKEMIDYFKNNQIEFLRPYHYNQWILAKEFKEQFLNLNDSQRGEVINIYNDTEDLDFIKYLIGRLHCRRIDCILNWYRYAKEYYSMKKYLGKINYENDFYFDYAVTKEEFYIKQEENKNKDLRNAGKKFPTKESEYYRIEPLLSIEDFEDEKEQQQNCVFTYIDDVIRKRSIILRLRKKEKPTKAYITIELKKPFYSNEKDSLIVRQALKKWNQRLDEEDEQAEEFIKEYVKELNELGINLE